MQINRFFFYIKGVAAYHLTINIQGFRFLNSILLSCYFLSFSDISKYVPLNQTNLNVCDAPHHLLRRYVLPFFFPFKEKLWSLAMNTSSLKSSTSNLFRLGARRTSITRTEAPEELLLNALTSSSSADERVPPRPCPFVLESKVNIATTSSWLTTYRAKNQSHIP